MALSTKILLAQRENEMTLLSKAFRMVAVELSKVAPERIEPTLHAVMDAIGADLTAMAQKFPQGIGRNHPLALTAQRFQGLIAETRSDIQKAEQPH